MYVWQGFYLPGVAPRAFKDGEAVQMKVQTLVSTETPLQVTFFGIAWQLFGGDMSAHEDATGFVSMYRMRQDSETAPIEAFSSEKFSCFVSCAELCGSCQWRCKKTDWQTSFQEHIHAHIFVTQNRMANGDED